MKTKNEKASVFELNGIPSLKEAFPLALQHVVAMIVGCVTPAIIISQASFHKLQDLVSMIKLFLCRQPWSLPVSQH